MKPSTILFLIIFLVLIVLTAGVSVLALKAMQAKAKPQEEAIKSIPVHVVEAAKGEIDDVIYVTGTVEAYDRVDVIAKIPAPGKLIQAKVKVGDKVRKDQVLATVNRDEVGAVYLAYGVKAPASGVVAFIQEDPGALVTPQAPVASIINIDRVKVKTSILEVDLERVKVGTPARVMVDSYPDRSFEGEVTRIDDVLDELSHTANAEITVKNPGHELLPAMFARIDLVADTKQDAVILPKETIMKRQGIDRAYVIRPDKKDNVLRIVMTDLELGYYDTKNYEILSGVQAGDLVVDKDLVVLKDQTIVSVENPPEGWVNPVAGSAKPAKAPGDNPGSADKGNPEAKP